MQKPSPHPNQSKREIVQKLSEAFSNSVTIVMADYNKMSVADVSEFRKACRKENVQVVVAKNTLAKLALKDYPQISPYLKGQTIFIFSEKDAVAPIKAVINYSQKNNDKPALRATFFDKQIFNAEETEKLKDLPSREQLIAQIIGLLEAPISQFVGVLQEILRGVPAVLESVSKKNS
ncbi:MAG: 50S ribosomal protein L10 [bacterium]|nr:50S ribosomal protein L10 [bacterium]